MSTLRDRIRAKEKRFIATEKGEDFEHPRKWYTDRMRYATTYSKFAEAIYEVFAPTSVFDVGCGIGWIVEWMREKGIRAYGVEGSVAAFPLMPKGAKPFVSKCDLRFPPLSPNCAIDLCVCIEVAEHIEEEYRDSFLAWTTQAERLLITAAPRGQGGNHHVNEQPPEYWIKALARLGWRYEEGVTDTIRSSMSEHTIGCPWVPRNVMAFRNTRLFGRGRVGREGEPTLPGRQELIESAG